MSLTRFTPTPNAGSRLALSCVGLVTLGLAAQLFFKIHRYAVNVLFSDQWDTYAPLFQGYSLWQSFALQSGIGRMGVGTFVTEVVAMATGWNTRAEAFVIGSIMVLVAMAAVYLKARLFGKLTAWDALIPMIFLGVTMADGPVVVPFPAYSAVPLLLHMLYALCLTCQSTRLRYGLLSLLNFLLVFANYHFFAALLTPCWLVYAVYRHAAERDGPATRHAALALALSPVPFTLFFMNYHFLPAVDCFEFPHKPLLDYMWFVATMFSNSVGVPFGYYALPVTRCVGTLIALGFIAVLAFSLRKLFRGGLAEPAHLVAALFIGFSLLFAVNAAIGRVCLGEYAAHATRYLALMSPAWLGVYFAATSLKNRHLRAGAGIVIFALCFLLPQSKSDHYERSQRYYSDIKRKWIACYLRTGDAALSDTEAGLSIYAPNASPAVQDRLDYLQARQLNFFADR